MSARDTALQAQVDEVLARLAREAKIDAHLAQFAARPADQSGFTPLDDPVTPLPDMYPNRYARFVAGTLYGIVRWFTIWRRG